MSRGPSLRVTSSGPVDHKVELDGTDISSALKAVDIRVAVGEVPTVRLDVRAIDLSNATEGAKAYLPDETRDLLVRLGWTPPEEDT